jgi:hypothetical protein
MSPQAGWLTLSLNLKVHLNWEVAENHFSLLHQYKTHSPLWVTSQQNIDTSVLSPSHPHIHSGLPSFSTAVINPVNVFLGASIVLSVWVEEGKPMTYRVNPELRIILTVSRNILVVFAVFCFELEKYRHTRTHHYFNKKYFFRIDMNSNQYVNQTSAVFKAVECRKPF